MSRPEIVLASASPARRRLLIDAGITPRVVVSHVDEELSVSELAASDHALVSTPAAVAEVLAYAKAWDVAARIGETGGSALVIGCDSVLDWRGNTWGKPASAEEATERWQQMRGTSGTLHTGHCLIDVASGRADTALGSTKLDFADISDAEISTYVATGEPLKVAGGFTLDGLGAPFVDRINGDPSNVIGLSLPLLRRMLAKLGYGWY